ncbi:Delta-aminolevulinic acid dehydratase [bioreactor metagenome]|mgnify:CR=1 FL=1|uniref:Delta-aminolevulinic acid dehydratase n=1 Tax=bioreactor metagenome TaxID=1076179 RepID=A0A644T7L0_9ZZZZ|nr:porphobilinogen synthase [Methanobrevibacter sp.]MEA4957433.1 porphobilinogen synthase [Methanobrevibacter sp.]
MNFPITRMRRLRKSPEIRDIFRETKINKEDLIYPIFIKEGIENGEKEPISTMPGEYRYSIDDAVEFGKSLEKKGLKSIIIFGMPLEETKDEIGSPAFSDEGIVQKSIRKFKEETNLVVISDVCLCQYTSHGHCGILNEGIDDTIEILNDETLDYLAEVALSHAEAGADIVAPSDMMDGRVMAIRDILDKNGHENTLIMSYSAKYASSFYAPFREAVCSAPSCGDRKSYQMDPANSREAIRESELDIVEGADVLMVKPALAYLDIIKSLKKEFDLPLAAYNVSGEYSMIKAGIEAGYLTEDAIIESLISIKRAGADLILTHFVPDVLDKL